MHTLDLITEHQQLAAQISVILESASTNENGTLLIPEEEIEQLLSLQNSKADNTESAKQKAEALLFVIGIQQQKADTYMDTIRAYRAAKNKANRTVEYLKHLVLALVDEYGEEGRLPTQTFPKLKAAVRGKKKYTVNKKYTGVIKPEWLQETLIQSVEIDLVVEECGGEIPVDGNGQPLYLVEEPQAKVYFK